EARRHRQGGGRPPSENSPRRDDRRQRNRPRQHRGRALRAHRGRLGGVEAGAAQHHGRRRAGEGHRRSRLSGTGALDGSTVLRFGPLTGRRPSPDRPAAPPCATAAYVRCSAKVGRLISVDVQEIRKLETYLKNLFGNARLRVVPRPKKEDSAEVYIGDEFIGVLFVDDEDDERAYNFQMAILGTDLE